MYSRKLNHTQIHYGKCNCYFIKSIKMYKKMMHRKFRKIVDNDIQQKVQSCLTAFNNQSEASLPNDISQLDIK